MVRREVARPVPRATRTAEAMRVVQGRRTTASTPRRSARWSTLLRVLPGALAGGVLMRGGGWRVRGSGHGRSFGQAGDGVPGGTGDAECVGEHILHRGQEPVHVLTGDGDGREELDDLGVVAGDLREDLVLLHERDHDHLAEDAEVELVEHVPGHLELERL